MRDVVIVEAVRSPLGRRGGGLAGLDPTDLLGTVQVACMERAGIDPAEVQQVIAGCVSQVGEQAYDVARRAWLDFGLPIETAAVMVETACGSSQQAVAMATAAVASGAADVVLASGVESMSRVPIASALMVSYETAPTRRVAPALYQEPDDGMGIGQFGSAERMAAKWGITRQDCDELGLRSQQLAQEAWAEGRYDREVVPVTAPTWDRESRSVLDTTTVISRDEGLRPTTLEGLAALNPIGSLNAVHTAGTASQITDGAASLLLMTSEKAKQLGLRPRARIVDTCFLGVDPVLMLTGPIEATKVLLERNGRTIDEIDVFEINEAFASVVLAWERETKADMDRVNRNGGALALGHPVGATGARLITSALHELERTDATTALVAMCVGGGLGTGTLIERV